MQKLDHAIIEGLPLLEKKLITEFNLEDDSFLNGVSLNLKYYHNTPTHISHLTLYLKREFRKRFYNKLITKKHNKIGIFRWEKNFEVGPENEYFVVEREGYQLNISPIPSQSLKAYGGDGFIIAKDNAKILDILIKTGEEGEFVYKFLRERCSKKIFKNGELTINPNIINGKCHQTPLILVKDSENFIKDKSGLIRVVNLKFIKKNTTLQSIINEKEAEEIFKIFGKFSCEFTLKKEYRYVCLEFAYYIGAY